MRIDYSQEFVSKPLSLEHLMSRTPNRGERRLLQLAILHNRGEFHSVQAPLRKMTTYIGYWPKVYALAMLLSDPAIPLEQRLPEFALGLFEMFSARHREQIHIPFTEAVLLWDYMGSANLVPEGSTKEMIGALVDELAKDPNFRRTLTALLCIHEPNRLDHSALAMPSINRFLLARPDVCEVIFRPLRASFVKAMNLFDQAVWEPYCTTSERIDMRMRRDLGL